MRNATRNVRPPRQPQPTSATAAARSTSGRHASRSRGGSRGSRSAAGGSPTTASTAAAAATPTNASRQVASAASPPSSGAVVCPAACIEANSPSERPSRSRGVVAAIVASSSGVVNAFATPCTPRPTSSSGNVADTTHSTEPAIDTR